MPLYNPVDTSSAQPLDSDLTDIAALTTTALGRGLLDDADAAAVKATLGLTFSGALVKKSVDQTTADYSAFPNVTWNAEEYDTDAYHDNSTNPERLTVPAAGYYQVAGHVNVTSNTLALSDYIRMTISRFNSSGVQQSKIGLPNALPNEISNAAANMSVLAPSAPIPCAAGDYFILSFDTETDTSITVEALISWFGIWKVG